MSRGFTITDVKSTATRAECRAGVPHDLNFFSGHFDGYPVLPGAAQLDALVLELAREVYPELGPLRRASRIKFRKRICPGDELTVVLARGAPEATTVRFEIARDGDSCSEGCLHFEVAP